MTKPNQPHNNFYGRSDGVLAVVKRMIRHKDQAIRAWGRLVESAYWREKQLPLIPDNTDSIDDEQ